MEQSFEAPPIVDRLKQRSLTIGVVALIASAIGGVFQSEQFFRSYLFGFLFWSGIALGSMVIAMIHGLTGGGWGAVIRRILESSIRTLPLLALLFVPVLAGITKIYVWTNPQEVAAHESLRHKVAYLNIPFFSVRSAIYFALWILLAYLINKWGRRQDEEGETQLVSNKRQFISGIGLLLYGLTMTFASIDWMMSLEPEWASTIYGMFIITGQVLSAFAFTITVASILVNYKPLSDVMEPVHFHDLGKLTLAFVMIWAYLAISQFLIIWAGNLPEEIPWYIHRLNNGWQVIALGLVLFHFTLPFLLLLSRQNKRNTRILTIIAVFILFMRMVDLFWLVMPDFNHEGFHVSYLDFLLPIGIGGIWLAAFFWQLKTRPVIPVNDPIIKEALEHGHA